MTKITRAVIAAMVGLSGGTVMAAINWGFNNETDGRLMIGCAFLGAALAGGALAGQFGRRPLIAIIASLTATVFGASFGAFLFFLRPDAALLGPIFVVSSLLDVPLVLALWALTQLGAHLGALCLHRRMA